MPNELSASQRLQRLAERVPGVLFEFHQTAAGHRSFPYVSAGVSSILELASEQVQADASLAFARVHPDDLAGLLESIAYSTAHLSLWHHEFRVCLPERGLRWLRGEALPNRNPDSSITWHGHLVDISDRKQDEAQLIALSSVVAHSDDIIVVKGLDLRVTATNQAFAKASGHSSVRELIGKTDAEIFAVSPETEPIRGYMNDDRQAQTLAPGEFLLREEIVRSPNGQERHFLTKKYPIFNDQGSLIGTGNISTDITERKRDEIKLRKLTRAVEQSSATIVITDLDGNIEYVNPAFCRATGYSAEEALGQNPRILKSDSLPPESYRELWESISSGKDWHGEFLNKRKDGSLYWEMALISPIRNAQGKVSHYLAFKEDITERKRTEAVLVEAKDQAEAANRAKSVFLANMSHEIRTPMNGVMGMAELLLGSSLDSQQDEWVRVILQSSQHLLSIINDILDFSRIESGKLSVDRIRFDLPALIYDSLLPFHARLAGSGVELLVRVDPDLPRWYHGDPGRIRQILSNLVGNAVKFTHEGFILVSVTHDQQYCVITVQDSGPGIVPERQAALFQPFEQEDNSTARRFGGTGLGLAISRRLAEIMDGTIDLHSVLGQGSSFTVRLKIDPDPEQEDCRQEVDLAVLRDKHILLVSDMSLAQDIFSEQLRHYAMQVDAVTGITAALQHLREQPCDVLLLDLHGSLDDGLCLLQYLQDAGLNARVLLCCSHAQPGDAARVQAAGVHGYVVKPCPQQQLAAVLAALLATDAAGLITRHTLREANSDFDHRSSDTVDEDHPLRNRHILLAEDNQVNQLVLSGFLRTLGCKAIQVVDGGQAAFDRVCQEQPDLILMDVQMPDIDGFAATQMIRRWEEQQFRPALPIIAVTANAMAGDRERCLAAGMDDYISKPIKLDDLRSVLLRHLPPSGQ